MLGKEGVDAVLKVGAELGLGQSLGGVLILLARHHPEQLGTRLTHEGTLPHRLQVQRTHLVLLLATTSALHKTGVV